MTLQNIRDELARIQAHPLTPTSVISIEESAQGILFEFDASDEEMEIAELKESEARLEKENADLEAKIIELEQERDALTEMHADFKDPESGITPADYRKKAEEAERLCAAHKVEAYYANQELAALRKRKGVMAELFKHQDEIISLLSRISRGSVEFLQAKADAAELIKTLHSK